MSNQKVTAMAVVVAVAAAVAACGSKEVKKGGGAKGSAAKEGDQKTGSEAKKEKGKASQMGEDYDGVTCDSSTEGLGWCEDDFAIAFCSSGSWYILDCAEIGGFCGDDGETIDCYF